MPKFQAAVLGAAALFLMVGCAAPATGEKNAAGDTVAKQSGPAYVGEYGFVPVGETRDMMLEMAEEYKEMKKKKEAGDEDVSDFSLQMAEEAVEGMQSMGLTVNADGTFNVTTPGEEISGVWEADGDTLTMTATEENGEETEEGDVMKFDWKADDQSLEPHDEEMRDMKIKKRDAITDDEKITLD